MQTLIVVDKPSDWPLDLPNVLVVSAKDYLSQPLFRDMRRAKVFNLCKCYRYQSTGYYVSLLAEARGHDPLPSVSTMQDMKSQAVIKLASGDLQRQIEKDLTPIKSDTFVLSVYFGRNLAKRYDRLAGQLFEYFKAPFLRAHFAWHKGSGDSRNGAWHLVSIGPIAAAAVPKTTGHSPSRPPRIIWRAGRRRSRVAAKNALTWQSCMAATKPHRPTNGPSKNSSRRPTAADCMPR